MMPTRWGSSRRYELRLCGSLSLVARLRRSTRQETTGPVGQVADAFFGRPRLAAVFLAGCVAGTFSGSGSGWGASGSREGSSPAPMAEGFTRARNTAR